MIQVLVIALSLIIGAIFVKETTPTVQNTQYQRVPQSFSAQPTEQPVEPTVKPTVKPLPTPTPYVSQPIKIDCKKPDGSVEKMPAADCLELMSEAQLQRAKEASEKPTSIKINTYPPCTIGSSTYTYMTPEVCVAEQKEEEEYQQAKYQYLIEENAADYKDCVQKANQSYQYMMNVFANLGTVDSSDADSALSKKNQELSLCDTRYQPR